MYFQTHLRGGEGLIETGGAYLISKRRWYQFSIKKLEYKVEMLKYKKLEVMKPRTKNESELLVGK